MTRETWKGYQLTSIHLGTRRRGIRPVRIADKSEALRPLGFPILGKEDSSDMAKPREHFAQVLLLRKLRHIGNTQRRQIVPLELATHLLARATPTPQMRRHVARAACAEPALLWHRIVAQIGGVRPLTLGRHGILERTLGGPVVSAADPALDLRVLEHVLLSVDLALVLGARLPVRRRAEHDVLCHAGRVGLRAERLALLLPEFGPVFPFGDARVHDLLDGDLLDAAGCLDFFAVFADRPCYDGLGSVFVLGDLLGGERDGVLVFFFGPVGASEGL